MSQWERDAFTAALADQRLGLIGGRDVGDRDAMAVTRRRAAMPVRSGARR